MKRHSPDTLSLIAGLFFATLAVVWLIDDIHTIPPHAIGWIFASVFTLAGVVGLVRAIRRPRSEETDNS